MAFESLRGPGKVESWRLHCRACGSWACEPPEGAAHPGSHLGSARPGEAEGERVVPGPASPLRVQPILVVTWVVPAPGKQREGVWFLGLRAP